MSVKMAVDLIEKEGELKKGNYAQNQPRLSYYSLTQCHVFLPLPFLIAHGFIGSLLS